MSTSHLRLDRLHMPVKPSFVTRYADYLILCVVAGVGLLGSLYIFANKSMNQQTTTQLASNSILYSQQQSSTVPVYSEGKFDSLVKIEGDLKANSILQITLVPDASDERYYLDMGNQQRAIFTSQQTYYSYPAAGTYTMELKVLRNRLLTSVASKEITIKE